LHTLREAQILIEQWRIHYNTVRPQSALGYRPPAPQSIVSMDQQAHNALTIKPDHPMGARHRNERYRSIQAGTPVSHSCFDIQHSKTGALL